MKLTAKLAYSQIASNRSRTLWTLTGIMLSTAMITAVFGFVASGMAMVSGLIGDEVYYRDMYNKTIAGLGMGLCAIIVFASVVVVSNAFRVSAGERTRQFGILKSVGATQKQIARIITHEGLLLSAIGIPLGIALGLLLNFSGIRITDYFLRGINELSEQKIALAFTVAWQAILLSVALSLITVWFSAWLPARKAAKISAIEAIRSTGEIKVKAKQVRANPLVRAMWGFEGVLASKSLKRSRRNFRATVVSLTVSIALLITVGAFGGQIREMTDTFYLNIEATVISGLTLPAQETSGANGARLAYPTTDSGIGNDIAEKLREYPDAAIFGAGNSQPYTAILPDDMLTPKMREALDPYDYHPGSTEHEVSVSLVVADKKNYEALCKRAGVPSGSNILINQFTHYVQGGRSVFAPYVFDHQTLHLTDESGDTALDVPLHGVLGIGDIPGEILYVAGSDVIVLVPRTDIIGYEWFANTADDASAGFAAYAKETLEKFMPPQLESAQLQIIDLVEGKIATQNTGRLIMVFIYGFVSLLALIALTNIISTISANVRSRAREFALLQSVGMTPGGLARMLNLESVLCSAKALMYGIPLGIIGSYLVFRGTVSPVEFRYSIPWIPIAECALGVFVITWAVMRYAASRLRGGSIVEAIRSEVV